MFVASNAMAWQSWLDFLPLAHGVLMIALILVWIWSVICPNCRGFVGSGSTGGLTRARCSRCRILLA